MNTSKVITFHQVIKTDNYEKDRKKISSQDVDKLEQAIDVHGYRGSSKMKHNGVVLIKPTDKKLWKVYNKNKDCAELKNKGDIIPVKVVAHCPNGNRGVGAVYNDKNGLILVLLGIGNYSGKLK